MRSGFAGIGCGGGVCGAVNAAHGEAVQVQSIASGNHGRGRSAVLRINGGGGTTVDLAAIDFKDDAVIARATVQYVLAVIDGADGGDIQVQAAFVVEQVRVVLVLLQEPQVAAEQDVVARFAIDVVVVITGDDDVGGQVADDVQLGGGAHAEVFLARNLRGDAAVGDTAAQLGVAVVQEAIEVAGGIDALDVLELARRCAVA